MDLDDFWEPEVAVTAGIAAVVTAAVASPRVRKLLRQGAVYGLAGALIAGDKIAAAARGATQTVRQAAGGPTGQAATSAATEAAAEAAT
jgi:hypothetical protein